MHRENHCLICDGTSLRPYAAVFSPFIAKRVWKRGPFPVTIMECERCQFAFAGSRFDPEEEHRLYESYRGTEYQAVRESCEPWYTPQFNVRLSKGTMAKRRAPLAGIFREHLPPGIKTILDFGGDRGDLFDGLVSGASTSVYDISGIEAADGVQAICTLDECGARRFDLIACSNVVEHVASPKDLLSDIRRIASPTTLVFVEVPSETPFGFRNYFKRSVQQIILLVRRPRLSISMLPFRFLRQVHEHVNFFSLRSLVRLMQVSGFEVLAKGIYPSEGFSFGPYTLAAGNLAWSLGRLPNSGAPEESNNDCG